MSAIYGWFDDAAQTEPTHSPPLDAPCLYCGRPLTMEDMRTYSIMPQTYAPRSYFYRVHKTCDEAPHELHADDIVFQMIARAGD